MVKIAQNFGTVAPPPGVNSYNGGNLSGLPLFFSVVLRTMVMFAGLYTLLNVILAGYDYLSAGGDVAKIQHAGSRIARSIWGLVVAAGAFILAAIAGQILFDDYSAIIQIRIYGP